MSKMLKSLPGLIALVMLLPLFTQAQAGSGAEDTSAYFPMLRGKKIGVVANNASEVSGVNIVDFLAGKGFGIKRIFSPEHGFRSAAEAGQHTGDMTDPVTGIPVVSLYNQKRKPAPSDLDDLDLVVFDIQDVGVRFYTYISTLAYVMEACAENGKPLVLLDRPNPNGFYVDGPVLEAEYSSFVGMHPVPVVYGMTIGEYGSMVNGEHWLKNGVRCDLRVVMLAGYNHHTKCTLPVKPSPNLPNINAVYLYPSLCLFEGTIISIGRGTPFPFEVFGHPGLKTGTFDFSPSSVPGASLHPPFEGQVCHGTDLRGYMQEHPEKQGRMELSWLLGAFLSLGGEPGFFTAYFNKLAGNATLQRQVREGKPEKEIRASWKTGIDKFMKTRKKYLMYKE